MSNIVERLTENIVSRDLGKEGAALITKWEKTGLLEGLSEDNRSRDNMALMLENQAKELLREASTMSAGDVQGFAAVAFPIVRRVFGGLLANELVSVQPMSLPSGLIFFLDFQYTDANLAIGQQDESVYGGNVVGSEITNGVNLDPDRSATEDGHAGGFYNLASGYSSPTGSVFIDDGGTDAEGQARIGNLIDTASTKLISSLTEAEKKMIRYDPDVLSRTTEFIGSMLVRIPEADYNLINLDNLMAVNLTGPGNGLINGGTQNPYIVRRLTKVADASDTELEFFIVSDAAINLTTVSTTAEDVNGNSLAVHYPLKDNFENVGTSALGAHTGADPWGLEEHTSDRGVGTTKKNPDIPEIDIQVDSVSVTAMTKKLKAKWSPELGQDLNAYHNLDAEVELTSILSEQIALEIDREILNDLVTGAKAGTYYWSRSPGLFVHKTLGTELGASSAAPDFTGTVSEWYETLLETVNDLSAQIHRKTVRGGANFIVTSPEVASILEMTSGFRASVAVDEDKGTAGAVNVGQVSKKWDVYVDPYFVRNVILVGRKGSSFLESGYVYAPYVPLQVTPTIFGVEDFTPRKGVMTRYAKKMVRPDMYGVVVVRGLLGEAGATS